VSFFQPRGYGDDRKRLGVLCTAFERPCWSLSFWLSRFVGHGVAVVRACGSLWAGFPLGRGKGEPVRRGPPLWASVRDAVKLADRRLLSAY
jgi:hypothetical protein